MAPRTKTFDRVEMKRGCERELREEYAGRLWEFAWHYGFVEAKTKGLP